MKKKVIALFMTVVLLFSLLPVVPVAAEEPAVRNDAEKFVRLEGDWHFKLYRTYSQMFQYFPYVGVSISWEDLDAAELPKMDTFGEWPVVPMPYPDYQTGGLLPNQPPAAAPEEPDDTEEPDDIGTTSVEDPVPTDEPEGENPPDAPVPGDPVPDEPGDGVVPGAPADPEGGVVPGAPEEPEEPVNPEEGNLPEESVPEGEEPEETPAVTQLKAAAPKAKLVFLSAVTEEAADESPAQDSGEEPAAEPLPAAEEPTEPAEPADNEAGSGEDAAAEVEVQSAEEETGEVAIAALEGDTTYMPTWSEAWVARTFTLPADFTTDETVTLLMGVIDDNDVIYINGIPVASSGFKNAEGQPIINTLPKGGFDYDNGVLWEKSYWEVEREYRIPSSVLNLGGINEIAVRLYNNNSYGGFYLGKNYALCGTAAAVRAVKGLPTNIVDDPEFNAVIEEQIAAIESGNMDAFAATVWDDYHHNAADKDARVAEIQRLIADATDVKVKDEGANFYEGEDGLFWYAGSRTITGTVEGTEKTLFSGSIEIAYSKVDGRAMEVGNWNRCYSTSYQSALLGKEATYSVYLPPSYYTDTAKTYPVVYLLHGQNSSSASFLNVDHIGDFMDAQIAAGNIMEMIVMMPDSGKNAFYRDTEGGPNDNNGPWATHIKKEIVDMTDATYRTIPDATMRGISGISMGGGGAMTIGTGNPDVFSSVASHMGWLPDTALEAVKSLTPEQLEAYDFYLDVGLQDTTVGTGGTIAIHDYLESVGKEHGYSLRDGGHNSAFYMAGMPASMKMHSDHFQGIENPTMDPDMFVRLDGSWHFKLYRTYSRMFQYFPYGMVNITSEDLDAAVYPAQETYEQWDAIPMPYDDDTYGGLLPNSMMPTWSEAWAVRTFELPANFTTDSEVTLYMGIIDDNDVVFINGHVIGSSGFKDKDNNPVINDRETGGFDYSGTPGMRWDKSYWEIERTYSVPAEYLVQGGVNEIAVRVFNNNSNGGFYANNTYAICGNAAAARAVKGLPSLPADAALFADILAQQKAALEANDLEAYAATVSDDYHNDAALKADRLAELADILGDKTGIIVEDTDKGFYKDEEGRLYYAATRTITYGNEILFTGSVSIAYMETEDGLLESGNWNRCYGTSYQSALLGREQTYSIYLPPSYYTDTAKTYPVVYLLHGQNSSSTSYRDVDHIGDFMDAQIAAGNIMEMIVVMPDSGKNAFYRDSAGTIGDNNGPWATHLYSEMVNLADATYRTIPIASMRGLTGNSMGGYGAVTVGTAHPEVFSSVASHMGYLPSDALQAIQNMSEADMAAYDFYFDAGLQDQTVGYQGTVNIHSYLDSIGKEHVYDLRDGAHNSAFYMAGMPASMKMHSDHFQHNAPAIDPNMYVKLDGEWHFKQYRKYPSMFQIFNGRVSNEDLETALYPAQETFEQWDVLPMPYDDDSYGGLLPNSIMPTWSEAWAVRTFELPENFTSDSEVTLYMGIIDDNDVVYINGHVVGSSGFKDRNNNPVINDRETGGFDYSGTPGVRWEKSYWEIERTYTVPAEYLVQGGVNEIAVRVFNNNSNGGFYANNTYAICGNVVAARAVKGEPSLPANAALFADILAQQKAALEANDLEAYAATVSDNYHNDAAIKADRLAELADILGDKTDIIVEDTDKGYYKDEEGRLYYVATRTITSGDEILFTGSVSIAYMETEDGLLESGNWNRCYGTSYQSALLGRKQTYSIYLPPSYYTDTAKTYPVVYLLHGQNSSSTSYRDVDHIGDFMDAQIAAGNIMEMIVVMPDSGKNAFYRDSSGGPNDNNGPWATHLYSEMVNLADSTYRTIPDASMRGLTGNSMGGYGAVTVGTKHPEVFSSVASHMGYLPSDALQAIQNMSVGDMSVYDFYFDAGLQDQTVGYQGTVNIHNYLESIGKEHVYDLRDGAHNSAFYMAGMPASMKMHSDHFQNPNTPENTGASALKLDRDYVLLPKDGSTRLHVVEPKDLPTSFLSWTTESGESIDPVIEVKYDGTVTAKKVGTDYVIVSMMVDGQALTARCRIDVEADATAVTGVDLTTAKATTELFRKDYTQVEILPLLEQNLVAQDDGEEPAWSFENVGAVVSEAHFKDEAVSKLFDLKVIDDRTLEIRPTEEALANPKSVKGSYKSEIVATVNGTEFTTAQKLALTVKKSTPKLKAEAVKLNSFVDGQTLPVIITGGIVASFELQTPDAKTAAIATLNDDLTVTVNNSTKKGSGKFVLDCELSDWVVGARVTVKVSSSYKAPKLSFKPASITLNSTYPDYGAATAWTLQSLPGIEHEITGYAIYEGKNAVSSDVLVVDFDTETCEMSVMPGTLDGSKHTYKVYLLVDGKEVSAATVKVLANNTAGTLSAKAAGAIDTKIEKSPITLTISGKNFNAAEGDYDLRILQKEGKNEPVAVLDEAEGIDEGYFELERKANNVIQITGTEQLKSSVTGFTYTVEVTEKDTALKLAKAVKLTVKTSKNDPVASVTLKATGAIDTLRPDTEIVLTPSFKNIYQYELNDETLKLSDSENLEGYYDIVTGTFVVKAKEGGKLTAKTKYTASLVMDGVTCKEVKLTVKMGAIKPTQSTKAITLLKEDRNNRQSVIISLNDDTLYDINEAEVVLDAKSANTFSLTDLGNGEYAIGYAGNKLPAKFAKATVKLNVYLKGNGTHTFAEDGAAPTVNGTANKVISVKVNFA